MTNPPANSNSQSANIASSAARDLFNAFAQDLFRLFPEYAAHLGVTEEMGFNLSSDGLDDESPKAVEAYFRMVRKYRDRLHKLDRTLLTNSQMLSVEILSSHFDDALEGNRFRHYDYAIDPIHGTHNSLLSLMTQHHIIKDMKDAEAYLARLRKYPRKFSGLSERLSAQQSIGVLPPASVIDSACKTMSAFIGLSPEKNPLYRTFARRVSELHELDLKTRQQLCQKALSAIQDSVYPAYNDFIERMEWAQVLSTDDAGVWKLPEGEAFYRYCLKIHGQTDTNADELHELGIAEVRKIQDKMIRIYDLIGVERATTFRERSDQYRQSLERDQPALLYPVSNFDGKQVIHDCRVIIDQAQQRAEDLFSGLPKTPVQVIPVSGHHGGAMGPHYQAASLNEKHNAAFYINLGSPPFKPALRTIIYHETIPGHHLQMALERDMEEVPIFRHALSFGAYVEGWASYAETLAKENNWFENSHEILCYHNLDLIRAIRLVVDTGIHHKRWSPQVARQYLIRHVGWGLHDRIHDYIVRPGRACMYMTGKKMFLNLRKQAKRNLGDSFDIKAFHESVLRQGAMPFGILERFVDEM